MKSDNPTKNGFYVVLVRVSSVSVDCVLIFKDGLWVDFSLRIVQYDVNWTRPATVRDLEILSPGLTLHKYFSAKRFLGLEVI